MKTRKEWRDAERQRIAHLEIGRLVNIGTGALTALLDDADELARLRFGLEKHIKWLRNEAGLHPSPDVFYLQADKLEGLLNNGDGDDNES